jgi:integrase
MPKQQTGSVDHFRGSWRARWADETGRRREKRGFPTKTKAEQWLRAEIDRVQKRRGGEAAPDELPTLDGLIDEYLAQHTAEKNTLVTLDYRLRHARTTFGALRVDRLTVPEIAAWRKQLSPASAWHIHKALRQILNYAVAAGYLTRNPARDVPNPEPKRVEVPHFDTPAELDLVLDQLPPRLRSRVVFAANTGLRPEEWIALERRDLETDDDGMVVRVRRVFTSGELKPYGKQNGSIRTVPVPAVAAAALKADPPRIDTPLLFPGDRGSYMNDRWFREGYWRPAVEAAGLDTDDAGRPRKLTPYSLRHTYATWHIDAGTELFELSRMMGTSVSQIDGTYGHLRKGAGAASRARLEAWQERVAAEVGT